MLLLVVLLRSLALLPQMLSRLALPSLPSSESLPQSSSTSKRLVAAAVGAGGAVGHLTGTGDAGDCTRRQLQLGRGEYCDALFRDKAAINITLK